MNTETRQHQTTVTLRIVTRLQTLAAPLDNVGRLVRWQAALAKAAQTDPGNPSMADIMDLVLLSIADANDPAARVTSAEVHIEGKTVARFSFPIIQLALICKVGQAGEPDGPTDQDDATGEEMKARLVAVFRRYHQDNVFTMTVADYETKLTAAGMFPEKAKELSRLIATILAGARAAGTVEGTKPLNQLAGGIPRPVE